MGKKAVRKAPKVWVCRGCCCGRKKKHPGVDHRRLAETARRRAGAAGAKFAVTECLGPCGQGNVVVVRAAGTIRWFRRVNDETTTALVVDQVTTGPGDELPAPLRDRLLAKREGRKPKP